MAKVSLRTRVYPSSVVAHGRLDIEVVWQAGQGRRADTYSLSVEQLEILRSQIDEQLARVRAN